MTAELSSQRTRCGPLVRDAQFGFAVASFQICPLHRARQLNLNLQLSSLRRPPQSIRSASIAFHGKNRGDRYCNASAKVTNTSGRDLSFVRLTTQFLKGEQLVGTEYSYTTPHNIPAGASVTWDNMYECPGKGTEVEITASSNEGILRVEQAN